VTHNPFHVAMPWQCGCRVELATRPTALRLPDGAVVLVAKTQPGRKTLCGICGTRRPGS
jgi:hypothetical protein